MNSDILSNYFIKQGIDYNIDDVNRIIEHSIIDNANIYQIKDNYDIAFIRLVWAYFRMHDKQCLEKYPNILPIEHIVNDYGKEKTEQLMEQNLEYVVACFEYFNKLVHDNKEVGIIRFIPNLNDQKFIFIMRIRNLFLIMDGEISKLLMDVFNQLYIKNNIFGNIICIDYYSE